MWKHQCACCARMHDKKEKSEWKKRKFDQTKDFIVLGLSAMGLAISFFYGSIFGIDPAWIAIILCGLPIIFGAMRALIKDFDIKADLLVAIATISAIIIGEEFSAAEVCFIMRLGEMLEEYTVSRARSGIESLVKLTPQTARIVDNDSEITVSTNNVKTGNIFRVLPGESIPVDGVIIFGNTSINESVLTGESLPVDKSIGDSVYSGSINMFGAFDAKATKVGEDSSMQRMIRLVQSADAGKAKIVRMADRWATYLVIASLLTAFITWMVTGEVIRAVAVLVVFCPCSLVLATPTAIMAAIGNATRHGFLIRMGDALERLAKVTKFAFDKTGTLTSGIPAVSGIYPVDGVSRDELYAMLASIESFSEHPLGKAVATSYTKEFGKHPIKPDKFIFLPGQGVEGFSQGKSILAGTKELLESKNIAIDSLTMENANTCLNSGETIIFVALDGVRAGFVALSDTIREYSKSMIDSLKGCKVEPVLLSGDNINTVKAFAQKLRISDAHGQCLPHDKLRIISDYQARNENVCMIGDGVNDAPALKKANVGIAMGDIGSDIAIDAADMVIVGDSMKEIPHLFSLAKHTSMIIRFNLSFSLIFNFVAIALAIHGDLSPIMGALVHNAGSVFVVLNSSLLLKWKTQNYIKKSQTHA